MAPILLTLSMFVGAMVVGGAADASTLPPDDASTSLAELVDQAKSILGPTDDAIGELAGLTAVPPGIPTPRNATVEGFDIYVFGGSEPYVDASVSFVTDSAPADLLAFYETELTAAGYPLLGEIQRNDAPFVTNELTFDHVSSTRDDAEVAVWVTSSEDTPDASVRVLFGDVAGPQQLDAFRGWTADLPLVDNGVVEVGSLSVVTILEPFLMLRTGYGLTDIDPLTARATFEGALPTGGGWDLDPAAAIEAAEDGPETAQTIYVDHELLDTANVSFEDSILDPTGTLVYVDATVDLPS